MHPNQKAYNPVFTSYRHGTNTVCTDGVDWVKKASGSEVFFYKLSKHQQANANFYNR